MEQLIIHKLYPLEKAPQDREILAVLVNQMGHEKIAIISWDKYYECFCTEINRLDQDEIKGWVPMPIYQPTKEES